MRANEVLLGILNRVQEIVHMGLKDVTPEQLLYHPDGHPNSIGWLAWHLTRVQDNTIPRMDGGPQLWTSAGWHAKFNMPADPNESGHMHTPEQVAAVQPPDAQTLLDFHDAVAQRTRTFLEAQDSKTLDGPYDDARFNPPLTIGARLVGMLNDNFQHAGQMAYLRGMLKGDRWYRV
jgi:uncharacterized damage-inducible protein DinB